MSPTAFRIQIITIVASFALFLFLFELVRRRQIKESYSLLWFFFAVIFLVFSCWRGGLEVFARAVGIAYPPAALFVILLAAVFLILIQFSVVVTKLSAQNKRLAQELGLLREEISRKAKGRRRKK